jgi:hypothetical protein
MQGLCTEVVIYQQSQTFPIIQSIVPPVDDAEQVVIRARM